MKSIITLLSFCTFAFILFSCRHEESDDPPFSSESPKTKEEQLPPITTTGAGTFGCKVNGKVWVAKSNTEFPHVYASVDKAHEWYVGISGGIIANPTRHDLINVGYYFKSNQETFDLHFENKSGPSGVYTDVINNRFWMTDSILGGKVHILRFDSIQQIVSGMFDFDCLNIETHDTLHITEGRFDMNFVY